jgi:preprotein translocase subunit YajC
MKRVGILLAAVALVVGMIGCVGTKCNLITTSTEGGSVTTPGEVTSTYYEGTEVELVAEAEEGYHFVEWTGAVGTIADVKDATTTIIMDGDYSITAKFVAVYGINISSTSGGSVNTPGEGTFTYDEGTVVNLVATPLSGYRFINWTGNVDTIANVNFASTTITMNDHYSITANFRQITTEQFNLTISSTAGGSVTIPGENTFTYDKGMVVSLVAQAEEGYHFIEWTGVVGTIADVNAASTSITMNDNYLITANFWEGDPCFIATAAYSTPMAEEIQILREFRDEYLLTNPLGRALVGLYYKVSPPIAEVITEYPALKPIVRAGLLPAVTTSTIAVNTTPLEKIAIIGLVVLVLVALDVLAIRRRGRDSGYTRR